MRRLTIVIAIAGVLLFGDSLRACSVPVFRYALERWQPDDFGVLVFHRGELSEQHQSLVARLSRAPSGFVPNVRLKTVNLDAEQTEEIGQFWKKYETDVLPWMVVQSPVNLAEVISVQLTKDNVDSLLDSPLRAEVAKRILNGDSVVWVLLESGQPQADQRAAETLSSEINRLQTELKLPEIEPQDIQDENLTVDPDQLKLKFSMVRLSRADKREQAFVQMLLSTESDLRDEQFAGQPMAFPVFGRGRVLYALLGKGINRDTIAEACEFLTGACQCTVKAQNPGVDLLTVVDWDAQVVPSASEDWQLPELVGLTQFGDTEATTADQESNKDENEESVAHAEDTAALDPTPVASDSEETVVALAPTSIEYRDREASADNAGSAMTRVGLGTIAICVLGGLIVLVAGLSFVLTRRHA